MRDALILLVAMPCMTSAMAVAAAPAVGSRPDCSYAIKTSKAEAREITSRDTCAVYAADGSPRFDAALLAGIERDDAGLGAVFLAGDGWYYVDRRGRSARVLVWDNGPDPFAGGLARSPRGGKVGFIDRTLTLRIPAAYDFAWPFEHGRATVCIGCAATAKDGDDHAEIVGGRWGVIDRTGKEIVPIRFTRAELERRMPSQR